MTEQEIKEKLIKMDLPKPIVIGKFELTEEERKKVDADFEIIIQNLQKNKGVMLV